ncbi:hypothetical protein ACFYW6_12690 [Streptomyces sp. NPDC002659]|nr:hypothetical protein [Streptomyces sp.]WSY68853.1 hypothetical protein OHA61_21375 [Streptomyces sp. NBC_00885]WSY76325.1 hypothetical protein OH805_20460 [Streptomyces sp. NBC_00879]HET6355533.1 hypothetical protein [Streptomyces sp.]
MGTAFSRGGSGWAVGEVGLVTFRFEVVRCGGALSASWNLG